MRRGFRGLGQPSSPLPMSPGGFCPTLGAVCPYGYTLDASSCPNYPCQAAAVATATTGIDFSFLTNPVMIGTMSIPTWAIGLAVIVGGYFLMGGKK